MTHDIQAGTKVRIGKGKAVWRVSAVYALGPHAGYVNLLSTDGRYTARYMVPVDRLHVLEDQR